MLGADLGRSRVIIAAVDPAVDSGRFPIKRTVGEKVCVEADAFADGHDAIACMLLYRREGEGRWREAPMRALVNDRWRAEFTVTSLGRWLYTVEGFVDHLASWRRDMAKRILVDGDSPVDYQAGAGLLRRAAARAGGADAESLLEWARLLDSGAAVAAKRALLAHEQFAVTVARHPDRRFASRYAHELPVTVDPVRARFSSWYEFFPRSATNHPAHHGTFHSAAERLDYIASMGFDVVYLPPIHPIGRMYRKGKNNSVKAEPGDVGSPWAIGAEEGGHMSVHPQLGTVDDFRSFVERAQGLGIDVAIDLAWQCAPDHPYVQQHPEWFRWRPDGTVQYAENPPKKYQDIYPFEFESDRWCELWQEVKSFVDFWIAQGVKIFRVDNPHTKPLPMWEWVIGETKREHPETIFLAEAFTRPKVMYQLAKLGFAQSYNYFPWRNTKWELTQYMTELTHTGVREFFRPNLWPNTPDILTEYLQHGGRAAFLIRLVLAATLGASYGIYGPAFELCENTPVHPGSEEYLDSEKYQIRAWNLERPDSLRHFIARVNRARRENAALQSDWTLRFHRIDNDQIICYSKSTGSAWCAPGEAAATENDDLIVIAVNLDPHHTQAGTVELPLAQLGLPEHRPYQVHDLIGDARYLWSGPRNYVELDPRIAPAQVFRVRRHVRSERDFDYFM